MNRPTLSRCFVLLVTFSAVSLTPAEQSSDLRKRLKDSSPIVRKQAALTLAEANDADAIPVLIDLLAELPAEERRPVEEFLTKLAGEWAPVTQLESEDKIARKIHRDAWIAWWRNTDGPALLALVGEHTLTAQLRQTIKERIGKLGDQDYATREAAEKELLALGRVALPQLREAVKDHDPERARRAHFVIDHIEQEPSRNLPGVAVHLLALRKPPGAAEALLSYLPLAEEENLTTEVKKSLALLALDNGKLEPALTRALTDDMPLLRAVAAESLVQGGGKEGRVAVRPLLQDKSTAVRLRVSLALAMSGEREAVPALIDLLTVASDDQIGQIEDVLTQLAGDSAPETPWSTAESDKQKCRDAWATWWKLNGERIDLTRLVVRPWYGYTLLCDSSRNRVFEIDRQGKERWAIDNVPFPVDAWVVGGNRVLVAEWMGRKISERDFRGNILWTKGVSAQPVNVQRLPNGHTFIATVNQLLEVDRGGKEVYTIRNVGGGITAAYRARDGRIVCLAQSGSQCIIMDTEGKRLGGFPSNRDGSWTSGIDLLANGHILITQPNRNKVAEYDRNGKLIVEVNAPMATTATGLPNGHFLVASSGHRRAFEVDRTGKVVWEHKSSGSIFRARRR
ncbi:MAG TPA: HEAT repeat domain-containing protein [Gemmataceae bacterium]